MPRPPIHPHPLVAATLIAGWLAACGADDRGAGSELDLVTDEFVVPRGEERYLCYAETLEEDLILQGFEYSAQPVIHHFLLARATEPEPDGISECDVLFRWSWVPLFGAGSGSTSLVLPADVGYRVPAGTQLVVQLHLLNATSDDIRDRATVRMRTTSDDSVRNAGLYAFGTTDIELPPHAEHDVTSNCTVDEPVEIFAVLPHMHFLGQRLVFEMGSSPDAMTEVYRREPWDFDDQTIDPLDLRIEAGTHTRVTCTYRNDSDLTVGFGESTLDEMCFLPTFAADRTELDGCLESPPDSGVEVPRDPAAGLCEDATANLMGIGGTCTAGGDECGPGLTCTADEEDGAPGYCIRIGCADDAACGDGFATCCTPPEGGGLVNICIHEACRPLDCIPVD